jgi:hypothetical protein
MPGENRIAKQNNLPQINLRQANENESCLSLLLIKFDTGIKLTSATDETSTSYQP